jgi:DNA polymerase III gamma/tau subunit
VRLQTLAAHFSEEDLVRSFHLLANTEKEIKDAAQPRFALELGLVKLTQATRLQSLNELIEKLAALETRLSGGGATAITSASKPRMNAFAAAPATVPATSVTAGQPKAAKPSLDELLDLPALPQLPKMPAALSQPATAPQIAVPAKPTVATAAQALSVPADWTDDQLEPPDFPELDLSHDASDSLPDLPSDNWNAPAVAARPLTRKPTESVPVRRGVQRPSIISGEEVRAIKDELSNRKQHLLVTALEDAHAAYEPGLLRVTMANDANDGVWANRLREAAATFRDVGSHLFGRPLRVELTFNSEVAASTQNEAQARTAAHEQAKQNPAVRLLLDKFKGEIVNVRAQTARGKA